MSDIWFVIVGWAISLVFAFYAGFFVATTVREAQDRDELIAGAGKEEEGEKDATL